MAATTTTAHSYLVLRDNGKYFPQGALATVEDGNECRPHSHFRFFPPFSPISIPSGDLAGLTEEECVLLDDVNARYAVYSTPGKLQWGVGLQVGDTVLARLPEDRRRKYTVSGHHGSTQGREEEEYATAIIRWKGMTKWKRYRFGVEIMVSDNDVLLLHSQRLAACPSLAPLM